MCQAGCVVERHLERTLREERVYYECLGEIDVCLPLKGGEFLCIIRRYREKLAFREGELDFDTTWGWEECV